MRIVDMNTSQLRRYVEDNYSINSLLELISKPDILDAIKKLEDIYEDMYEDIYEDDDHE